MSKRTKWILISVISVCIATGAIIGGIAFAKSRAKKNATYEVKYSLTASEKNPEKVTLPGTSVVPAGTVIGAVGEPVKEGAVFAGWYYDPGKSLMALPTDAINANITLYADFADSEGTEGAFKIDYMSELNVDTGFGIEIVSYGYSAEEILQQITVSDLSLGGTDVEFVLEKKATGPISLDEDVIKSAEEDRDGKTDGTLLPDASLTYADYMNMYGLEEGDSPERYWAEELGLSAEEIEQLTKQLKANEAAPSESARYVIKPKTQWQAGDLFQVNLLSTEHVRFVRDNTASGKDVIHFNFTVAREEINNLSIKNDVLFISVKETEGVDVKNGLYSLVADLNGAEASTEKQTGNMKYAGTIEAGTTIAVYDGELKADGTVDGEVIYLLITGKNADGTYAYEGAEFTDVLFTPDVLPIADDGSYDDCTVTVEKSALDFGGEIYRSFNLNGNTTVEPGDFIAFYSGQLDKINDVEVTGYGLITELTEADGKVTLTYEKVSLNDVFDSFQMYAVTDNVDIPLTDKEIKELEESFSKEARENGFGEEVKNYVSNLLTGDELNDEQYREAISNMTFEDKTGNNYSLEDIRLLGDKAEKVEISDPTIKAVVSPKLSHFEGSTGIRVEISAGLTVKINLKETSGGTSQLEIKVVAALEQEIVLGLSVSADADWKWYVVIPVLQGVDVKIALQAGTYTGLGASMAVTTKVDDSKSEWKKLVEANNAVNTKSGEKKDSKSIGDTLKSLKDTFKTVQNGVGGSKEGKKGLEEVKDDDDDQFEANGGVGGDLPDKYSAMLSNESKYVDIVNQKLFEISVSPDPIHLIEFSLKADFVVGLKVNCMMGWGISYANAKQYCFTAHINVFGDEETTCKSSTADLETPNFRADFYVFGNIGIRAGVRFDARVGVVSTKVNSIGIVAEVGLYVEAYGFLYVYYEWTSGEGSDMGIMGSAFLEAGVYLDINFCARIVGKKLNKTIKLYSEQWPLISFGAEKVPMEFEEVDKSRLTLEFVTPSADSSGDTGANAKLETNKLKVPGDVFKVKMMSLKDGKLSSENEDSAVVGGVAYQFVQNGITYIQYNEEHYDIRCVDLTGENGTAAETHQLRYLPETNELYVRPLNGVSEIWGQLIITYKNNTFGFNTNKITRTINVHWKGSPVTAEVLYYIKDANGTYTHLDAQYTLKETGEFSGFDGTSFDLIVDEAFCKHFSGYKLTDVRFDDEELLKQTYYDRLNRYNTVSDELKRLVNTGTVNEVRQKQEEVNKALAEFKAAKEAFFGYGENIKDVVDKQAGTLSFLMCSDNTVVKLFFSPVENESYWFLNVRGFEALDEGQPVYAYTEDLYSRKVLLRDSSVMDNMPDNFKAFADEHANHVIDWYYYETDARYTYAKDVLENKELWKPLTAETVMPDSKIVVVGVDRNAGSFTVTWKDEKGGILDSMEVKAGETIPNHSEIPAEQLEGKTFWYWKYEDGTPFSENDKMPYRDITLEPEFATALVIAYYSYTGADGTEIDSWVGINYGSRILETLNNIKDLPAADGKEFNWYIVTDPSDFDSEQILIEESLTMPSTRLMVVGRLEGRLHTVTWNNGTETKTEQVRTGDTVNLPAVTDSNGHPGKWTLDGNEVKGWLTMPDRDITLTAKAHEHVWETVREEKGTCSKKGTLYLECKECGSTKTEETHTEPDVHRFGKYVTVKAATTSEEGLEERECQDCHIKESRPIAKLAEKYTVIFRDDKYRDNIDRNETLTVEYVVGTAITLKNDVFPHDHEYLDAWKITVNDHTYSFAPGASIVWTEPAANGPDVIYLPALDPDGDKVIILQGVHAKNIYNVVYHVNNGTDAVWELEPSLVPYGEETEMWFPAPESAQIIAAGLTGKVLLGWATTPTGTPVITDDGTGIAVFPLYDTVTGGVLHLYAVWE